MLETISAINDNITGTLEETDEEIRAGVTPPFSPPSTAFIDDYKITDLTVGEGVEINVNNSDIFL